MKHSQLQHPSFGTLAISALTFLIISCNASGQINSADDLIAAHMEALGGYDNYKAINEVTFIGTYEEPRFKEVHRFDKKRPNLVRVTTNYDENTGSFRYCEGFDGSAWEYSSRIPVRVVGEPARALKNASQFEPSYIDYKKKNYTAKYGGVVNLKGNTLHHLQIIRTPDEIDNFFFDVKTLMNSFNIGNAPFHGEGKTIEIVEIRSDYRLVNGVMMAHSFVTKSNEKTIAELTWDKIEANTNIPDEWFSPPLSLEQERFKEFRENMLDGQLSQLNDQYQEYEELASIRFRKKLENELNTFGYELISYERYQDAIKVFKMAISLHPGSGNLNDSLGETYLTIGDTVNAVKYYKEAVRLNPQNQHAVKILKEINN